MAVPIMANATFPTENFPQNHHQNIVIPPMAAPTHGKKQNAYFISLSCQVNCGIGICEYMENAMTSALNVVIIISPPL